MTLKTAGRRWGERTERDSYQGCDKALSTAQWIIADPRTHAGGAGPQHHTSSRPAGGRELKEEALELGRVRIYTTAHQDFRRTWLVQKEWAEGRARI